MQDDDLVMWRLVSDVSQGMQISFASIKAAISSLLGGDIFWDQATQHEFMQTIDKSIDDVSGLTAVMTVAMRTESQTLPIHREPNSLQEILSQAKDLAQKELPHATINLSMPAETRLAYVDFEYLRMALRLLIEMLISTQVNTYEPISIQVFEEAAEWEIVVSGNFPGSTSRVISWLCSHPANRSLLPENLRAETKLKALVTYQLLAMQTITMTTNSEAGSDIFLVLHIPFETES